VRPRGVRPDRRDGPRRRRPPPRASGVVARGGGRRGRTRRTHVFARRARRSRDRLPGARDRLPRPPSRSYRRDRRAPRGRAGIPALLTFDAWATQSAKSLDPNSRDILLREGLELYETSPLVGIGPGRMVVALAEKEAAHPGSVELLQPTHGVPILALVEGGIQAGVLCAAVVLLMAWRPRRSWVGLALFGVYLPFILFDHYPYTHAQ